MPVDDVDDKGRLRLTTADPHPTTISIACRSVLVAQMLTQEELQAKRRLLRERIEQRRRETPILRRWYEQWLRPYVSISKRFYDRVMSRVWKGDWREPI